MDSRLVLGALLVAVAGLGLLLQPIHHSRLHLTRIQPLEKPAHNLPTLAP